MNKFYIVSSSKNGEYTKGDKLSANYLIDEFVSGLDRNNSDDADTIQWMNESKENGTQDECVEFIASIWGLSLKKCQRYEKMNIKMYPCGESEHSDNNNVVFKEVKQKIVKMY